MLDWFDRLNVRYKGAFAPLRLADYLYAFAQPEYRQFAALSTAFR